MADSYEAPYIGQVGAYCSACCTVKPAVYFKRQLTRAQAASRGYAGNVRVVIDSSLCSECRPKRKPTRKLTKKELLNRVAAGDLNDFLAKSELKRRHAEAKAKSSRAVNARWDKVRAKPWMDLVKDINQEINAVKHQRYYARDKGVEDLHKFSETYEAMLITQRAKFRVYARTQNKKGDAPPSSWWWPDYFTYEDIERLKAAWMLIPPARQQLTRIPLIFRNTEKPLINPHEQEDRLTQAKAQLKTYDE